MTPEKHFEKFATEFAHEISREYIREEVTGEIMNILADVSIKAKKYGMTDKQLHEILQKQIIKERT